LSAASSRESGKQGAQLASIAEGQREYNPDRPPLERREGPLEAPAASDVTRLLLAWRGGDRAALERLVPLVYAELRRLAHRQMRRERPGHTLQTTALDVSPETVMRVWKVAKLWLLRELKREAVAGSG